MANTIIDLKDFDRRMHGALDMLSKEFQGLRTGRASVNLLDNIFVEVYGSKMPINQLASVACPEPQMLTVQVWDNNNTKAVEKAISNSGLGLNPQPSGSLIRVPLPGLTEERRIEIAKIAHKYAEQAKVAIRNIRREAMEMAKKMKKDSEISEDELKKSEEDIQKMTDGWIKKIDDDTAQKEQEIKQV